MGFMDLRAGTVGVRLASLLICLIVRRPGNENPKLTITETRFYESVRVSTPPRTLFSLKPLGHQLPLDIVILGLANKTASKWLKKQRDT